MKLRGHGYPIELPPVLEQARLVLRYPLGDPDDALAASHEIVAVRADLLSSAAWLAALAAAMSGLMVVVFDWSASEMIPGG